MKTLDFEDDNSYENPNSKVFGDLNGNGVIETLKEELTNKDGFGFTPIGTERYGNFFKGTFDGQRNEIRNIYINKGNYYYAGLFGLIDGKIKNLGVTGEVKGNSYVAGVVGNGTSKSIVINCYNKCNVTGSYSSGIGNYGAKLINCYNIGNITGSNGAGGITLENAYYVINCYNTGNVISENMAGGIDGGYGGGNHINCSNMGNITGSGRTVGISSNGLVKNCYNTGNITGGDCGGIGWYADAINCINEGEVTGEMWSAGIVYDNADSCYNKRKYN